MIDDDATKDMPIGHADTMRHKGMDASERRDHLGSLLDEDDRRRRANQGIYRLRQEPRGLHVLAASALLPRGGFDHRALNAAPKSQRRR